MYLRVSLEQSFKCFGLIIIERLFNCQYPFIHFFSFYILSSEITYKKPCATSTSEDLSNEAASYDTVKCDAENSAPHQEQNAIESNTNESLCNASCDDKNAQCDAEVKDKKPRFKTAYDASLVSPKKYKRNFEKDHFYVLEAETHKLRIKFDKKGTNPLGLIFVALFVIVAGLLIIRFLPWILSRFDEIMGGFDRGYR